MTTVLADSLAAAKARGNDPARCGFELSKNILTGVREGRTYRPDLVLKYGLYLVRQHASSLSHELWATYEQVVAALLAYGRSGKGKGGETDEMKQAQEFVTKLAAQFPESLRVKKLEGLVFEAKGEAELANGEYDEILAEDPANLLAIKRQVALCRSRPTPARLAEAAQKLCKYLETFCSDHEGWVMLHELYLTNQQFKRAAFCVEELILINPMAYIYHLRAGEVTYTMGMAANGGSHDLLLTARKYFAHALELKPDGCLRALYGILLVCAAMGASTSTKAKGVKVDTAELLQYVEPQLVKLYTPAKGAAHPMRPLVLALLKTLGVGAAAAAPAASAGA